MKTIDCYEAMIYVDCDMYLILHNNCMLKLSKEDFCFKQFNNIFLRHFY